MRGYAYEELHAKVDQMEDPLDEGSSLVVGPGRSLLRPDLFESPPSAPEMVIEGFEPVDAGVVPGAGGTGKTTFELWLAIHRILGRPVFGLEILRPGPVLYVSAEDPPERIGWRVYQLCRAMLLNEGAIKAVLGGLHVEDLSSRRWRMVQADRWGNLGTTDLVDRLSQAYHGRGLSTVVCDPMVYFGPGERYVNDGEAELMLAGRRLSRALECSVRFIHHVGKANARDGAVDQHVGRGGSAGADNARFVHVLAVHGQGSDYATPAGVPSEDVAAGRILRLHVAKLTDAKRPEHPFWIRRDGWRFDWIQPRPDDPVERELEGIRALCKFVCGEADRGVKHTRNTLENVDAVLDLCGNRKELRKLLHVAISKGHLAESELPEGERKGRRTYFLEIGVSP